MTAYQPLTRTATFHARPGHGDELAGYLLQAASVVAETSGCELWLVQQDANDPDEITVWEMWASQDECDAALDLPEARETAANVMRLLDQKPAVRDGVPLGGARWLRGARGATAFRILDAPDLSEDAELLGRYDLGQVAEARYVREQLDALQVGLTHYRVRPGGRLGWAHRHAVAEEIYVALSGTGQINVDDDAIDLHPLVAVRVAPGSARELVGGPEGLEALAFGTHWPGDGEMVDRSAAA